MRAAGGKAGAGDVAAGAVAAGAVADSAAAGRFCCGRRLLPGALRGRNVRGLPVLVGPGGGLRQRG